MVKSILFIFSFFILNAQAQDKKEIKTNPEDVIKEGTIVVEVDLDQLCQDSMKSSEIEVNKKNLNEEEADCLICKSNNSIESTPATDEMSSISNKINEQLFAQNNDLENAKNLKSTCDFIAIQKKEKKFDPFMLRTTDPNGQPWVFKFGFGYTRTWYGNSDVTLQSSRYNVKIKDFEWKERSSFNYFTYETLSKKGNAFKFIDEPTSSIYATAEKGKLSIMFSVLHYKYLMDNSQVKHIEGTIDGVQVNSVMPVRQEFDGYNNQPGESHIWRLESTYWQVNPQIGIGRKINIIDKKKAGTLSITPNVQAGIMIGNTYSAVQVKDGYWDSDSNGDNFKYQGTTMSAGARLEYERKRWTVFLDSKFTQANVKTGFLDGKAIYKVNYIPTTFGVSFKFTDAEIKALKKKKKVAPVN